MKTRLSHENRSLIHLVVRISYVDRGVIGFCVLSGPKDQNFQMPTFVLLHNTN